MSAKKHLVLEVSADFDSKMFSLENEVIDIKDELENFTLLSNVEVKVKSVQTLHAHNSILPKA